MPTPPSSPIHPDGSGLVKWIKSIESAVRLLGEKLNHVFDGTGLSVPGPGVTQVDQTFNVLGTQNVSGDLNVSGNLTVSGVLKMIGTAIVSGLNGIKSSNFVSGSAGWNLTGTSVEINTGAVGNSALVHPIAFDGNGGAVSNFSVTTTASASALVAVTNTVPAGMTKMASLAVGNVTAVNSTASLDYLQCSVGIQDPGGTKYNGNSMFEPASGSGGSAHVSAAKYGVLTGLTAGATVTHYISVWSSGGTWAANASSIADIQVHILWGA